MPKKVEEKIHILCPSRAYLAPAKVMGPIVHPLMVNKSVAVQILMSGAEVYEYIPKTKQTLKLTLGNINNTNRHDALNEPKKAEVKATLVEPVTRIGVPKMETAVASTDNVVTPTAETSEQSVVSETATSSTEADVPQASVTTIMFEYNEDGTVDETKIEWSKYSKNQRKEIRAQITAHNTSLTTK